MSHESAEIIVESILEVFDPNNSEYAGVREHFSTAELSKIDEMRAFPETHVFTFAEKAFVSYVVGKAIFTGD